MIDKKEHFSADFLSRIDKGNFNDIALEVFQYQYNNNDVYKQFTDALRIKAADVNAVDKIPFLPISFFRTHKVVSGNAPNPALVFESSGTTGELTSRHYVANESIYEAALTLGFNKFYGHPKDYAILALLPSYLERGSSSLVHMVKMLMDMDGNEFSGFYMNEYEKLSETIKKLEASGKPTLLIGVTFALLDFAEAYPMQLKHTIVMETGGMKGRREEQTRMQVHRYLKERWQLSVVHSEYGMTELLSQAYSKGEGIFDCADTMKVLVRDVNDPLEVTGVGAGCLNIIDLANVRSCSFIATDDLGRIGGDGSFEVLGRADNSILRGCNLMVI